MSAAVTKAQIGAIHALKARIGLDDGAYRTALSGFGVASSKELSREDAAALIDRFKGSLTPIEGGVNTKLNGGKPLANGALRLTGPYAGVCRALWLSAWNLGLVRDRRDTALTAFVKRQTGFDSVNWVRDPAEARQAIEALKAWIARERHVDWPTEKNARDAGLSIGTARKLAIIFAQQRFLGQPDGPQPEGVTDRDLDEAISAFGRAIRAIESKGGQTCRSQ